MYDEEDWPFAFVPSSLFCTLTGRGRSPDIQIQTILTRLRVGIGIRLVEVQWVV